MLIHTDAFQLVDYNDRQDGADAAEGSPAKPRSRPRRHGDSDSDTDFQADGSDDEESLAPDDQVDVGELAPAPDGKVSGLAVAGPASQRQRKPRAGPTGESNSAFSCAFNKAMAAARDRVRMRGVALTPQLHQKLEAAIREALAEKRASALNTSTTKQRASPRTQTPTRKNRSRD